MDFQAVADPLDLVDEWREKAKISGRVFPESMVLATVGADGAPHARVVLYKGRQGRVLEFFSNYQSAKAHDLEHEPRAELCIHYAALALQVRMSGAVQRLSAERSDDYFASRPRESQIGAWASQQSQVLSSRVALDRAVEEVEERFRDREVPRPPHWGGYGLDIVRVELWVGREGRLHDRARYLFEDNAWRCELMYP